MNNENLVSLNLQDEIEKSYLDYALSVIIGRAIPDVNDGLKPVHRRILYAMTDMGNSWNKPYKKSARIVGDVIGKYHPHGDSAVYDAIVRLAQDFSMRYQLVDGQGNFGSVDGDPPAAMRYTEIRLRKISDELTKDIEKDTVNFIPNYDSSTTEPEVLPSRIPNLLINGSSGIAVGMATNIPPHNLTEIVDSLIHLIDNNDAGIDDILRIVKGPDFPTGGIIFGKQGILDAYRTGRGVIKVRAKTYIETDKKKNRSIIVIKELPFQVNKARLLEKINDLVKNKVIEGVDEFRDESDREGMRVVIMLKRSEIAEVILNKLYKHTQLEINYGIILLAIDESIPKYFNIYDVLSKFLAFRRNIIINRTRYDLNKALEQCHLLEGLKIALENLDLVLSIIRGAENVPTARESLMQRLGLSELQARAILDMRLQKLTKLEMSKLIEEYNQLLLQIEDYRNILADPNRVSGIIKEELEQIKADYSDPRRTQIVEQANEINLEDLILEENMVVTITHRGYIKRTPLSIYKTQKRGGKGKSGLSINQEDFVDHLFISSTHNYLLIFSDLGKVYWLKVHEIPESGRTAKGKPIVNLLPLQDGENVASIMPIKEFREDMFVAMATRKGLVKRTSITHFSNPRSSGILALRIDDDDRLISTVLTSGEDKLFFATRNGKSLIVEEKTIRPMQRTARGVIGIRLRDNDYLISLDNLRDNGNIMTFTENGFGKRTAVDNYRIQARGGLGITNIKISEKNGKVVNVFQVHDADSILVITNLGKLIKFNASDINAVGRNAIGVKLINLNESEKVVAAQKVIEDN